MNSHIVLQDQRCVAMQEGIDSIRAMMMAKGADNWKGSWGEPSKGTAS